MRIILLLFFLVLDWSLSLSLSAMAVPLTLEQAADISVVSQYFTPTVASAISYAISNFLPYANNFASTSARQEVGDGGRVYPLHLEIFLPIRRLPQEERRQLLVVLTFTNRYPQETITALLVPPSTGERIKQPYSVMGGDGRIQVDRLSFLRGVDQPYPILDVLLAISEQFELEFPLSDGHDAALPAIHPPTAPPAAAFGSNDATRNSLIQEATEKVVIDLNEKASSYLDTREESLKYLTRLNEANRELHKAKEVLQKHEAELQTYIPNVGNVSTLLQQLKGHDNTPEEHANCLIPTDQLQARALELMAEIHASDDTLALLEDGLKLEKITCDEYVKYVSDVGREQFVSRFLLLRVAEQLPVTREDSSSNTSSITSSPPAIPQRLAPEKALNLEFPSVGVDVIQDVLASVNGDVGVARQQLKQMLS